jgi:hypothetical protein
MVSKAIISAALAVAPVGGDRAGSGYHNNIAGPTNEQII